MILQRGIQPIAPPLCARTSRFTEPPLAVERKRFFDRLSCGTKSTAMAERKRGGTCQIVQLWSSHIEEGLGHAQDQGQRAICKTKSAGRTCDTFPFFGLQEQSDVAACFAPTDSPPSWPVGVCVQAKCMVETCGNTHTVAVGQSESPSRVIHPRLHTGRRACEGAHSCVLASVAPSHTGL